MSEDVRNCVSFLTLRGRAVKPRLGTIFKLSARQRGVLIVLCLLMSGCRKWRAEREPTVEFTNVPGAEEGGPDKSEAIEGRVTGARPGQQIVLFALSGKWWLQPRADKPFTPIRSDFGWSNYTHLGTEYAALLVEPGYRPSFTLEQLPDKGAGVLAVARVKGRARTPAPIKTVRFSGYDWAVRLAASDRGGGITRYDPANVWVDAQGALHLKIVNVAGAWTGAEADLTRSLGYGSYVFVVREVSQLEPSEVLGIYTWDDGGTDPNHRELDVEISRWGDPLNKNGQYVVQPFYVAANVLRFQTPSGTLTHSFRWEPGTVSFRTVRGRAATKQAPVVAEKVFTSGVPTPGNEYVHLNFYLFGAAYEALKKPTEVIIDKFEYLP